MHERVATQTYIHTDDDSCFTDGKIDMIDELVFGRTQERIHGQVVSYTYSTLAAPHDVGTEITTRCDQSVALRCLPLHTRNGWPVVEVSQKDDVLRGIYYLKEHPYLIDLLFLVRIIEFWTI